VVDIREEHLGNFGAGAHEFDAERGVLLKRGDKRAEKDAANKRRNIGTIRTLEDAARAARKGRQSAFDNVARTMAQKK
jgi:hypothetical protein